MRNQSLDGGDANNGCILNFDGYLGKEAGQRCSSFNPLRPDSDLSETSHCNIKGLSVSEVMRIENMITQVKFY